MKQDGGNTMAAAIRTNIVTDDNSRDDTVALVEISSGAVGFGSGQHQRQRLQAHETARAAADNPLYALAGAGDDATEPNAPDVRR